MVRLTSFVLTAAVLMAPAVTHASYVGVLPPDPSIVPPLEQVVTIYRARFAAVRQEAIELTRRDGGKLSPSNRARMQAKLDRLNASWQRDLLKSDRFVIDAQGVRR